MNDGELRGVKHYLGYGNSEVDEKTRQLIEEVFAEYEITLDEKYIEKNYDCRINGDTVVLLFENSEIAEFKSKKLAKHLALCNKVTIFAATVGAECDRLMLRYEHTDIAKAAVCQACGAYFIERLCDRICLELQSKYETEITSRFSPGYGDLSVYSEKVIFDLLECRRIGLTLTDSCLMVPTKSVCAFVGLIG